MRRFLKQAIWLPVVAALALALAFIGRTLQGDPPGDALFHALQVLTIAGDYPDSAKWRGNGWIELARWVGLLFFLLTVRKAFGLLLATQWNDLSAQLARRDLVLVGDHPILPELATRLAKRRRVLWIDTGAAKPADGVRTLKRVWKSSLVNRYRLRRADTTVVALCGHDWDALTIAHEIADAQEGGEVALLSTTLTGDAATRLRAGTDGLRILSPDRLAARALHDGYPPFDTARKMGQSRINALFLGGLNDALFADLLLSSPATFLERPRITIVGADAEMRRTALDMRMPEIGRVADIAWVAAPAVHCSHIAALRPHAAEGFTIVYVAGEAGVDTLATALAFDDDARREGWPVGWIVFRQESGSAAAMASADGRLRPFGTADQIADSLGLLGGERASLARALHEAYRAGAPADAPNNRPWHALPQPLREANAAGFAHLPAKLASAGVALDSWIAARQRLDGGAKLPALPDLTSDAALLARLASLEHDRWMTEKLLAGWRYGAARDDARRIHPDLVPFADLDERVQGYDVNVVTTLAAALDGNSVKQRRAGGL